MDVVLGVSMAPTAVRMALVEGEDGDGLIVEEDSFRITGADQHRQEDTASVSDQVISAILGTREGAADAGLHLSSIGVSWTDQIQAAALRDALSVYKVENVMLVSAFLAATALGQAVGGAIGYDRTAVLFVEPDTATLAVVNTADGSVYDVRRQVLADDDDTAVAEIVELVSSVESMETCPDGVYVVGSGVDIALIKPQLEAATSLTLSVPEEHEMALARGAALAAGTAPLFVSSTAAFAYALDSDAAAAERAAYLRDVPLGDDGDEDKGELAYSSVPADPDDPAEAETLLMAPDAETELMVGPGQQRRRPVLLVGSGLAVVSIAAVIAMEIALAIGIRPTVALQPTPSQNHLVAPEPAPAPVQVEASAPKLNVPVASVPRAGIPHVPAVLPAAPIAPAPEAPAAIAPEPAVVVPPVPIVVPPVRVPMPDEVLRPVVPQAPVRVTPLAPEVPQPRAQLPASPPQPNPGTVLTPRPGRNGGGPVRGPGAGLPGTPGGGGIPESPGGVPESPGGPFGGHGPFGGGGGLPETAGGGEPESPGGGGPFGGHGPFGGGHGPFGGGGGVPETPGGGVPESSRRWWAVRRRGTRSVRWRRSLRWGRRCA